MRLSKKFLIGVILIIANFIVGKIAVPLITQTFMEIKNA